MIVYLDRYLEHNLESHPENNSRLKSIIEFLEDKGVFRKVPLKNPRYASEEELIMAHTKEHVEKIRASCSSGVRFLDADTYINRESFDIARLAVGGVLTCVEEFINNCKQSFALVRPPGHHATRNKAMGFCIFNNIAIGASYATKKNKKVFILDFDLHHGNGTQDIFYENSRVFYLSLHQYPWYPGTGSVEEIGRGEGKGFNVNIPLPIDTSDESYLKAFDEIALPLIEEFKPDLLMVSAGYDAHQLDPLGMLKLSTRCYYDITERLVNKAKGIIYVLEGGYNLNALSSSVYACLQAMFKLGGGEDYVTTSGESLSVKKIVERRIRELKSMLSDYWSI